MMKLWCFGDSNTYGYDPCGFFGGRYAAPWPELLAGKTGFQVINDGKNGRMMAGLLHDLYAYKSGSYDDHAHLGADYARKLLEKLAITTPEETDVICAAIRHHDSKAEVDCPLDEILKDADVIDHSLSDPTKEVKAHEVARYAKLCKELGLAD